MRKKLPGRQSSGKDLQPHLFEAHSFKREPLCYTEPSLWAITAVTPLHTSSHLLWRFTVCFWHCNFLLIYGLWVWLFWRFPDGDSCRVFNQGWFERHRLPRCNSLSRVWFIWCIFRSESPFPTWLSFVTIVFVFDFLFFWMILYASL